ncbi:MAG: ABC transporter permease [Clostridia bacterium]
MDEQKYPKDSRVKDAAGDPVALDDERRVKVLSPGMLVFKRFVRNKLAIAGSIIIIAMFLFSFVGGLVMPYSESQVFKEYQPMIKDYAAVTTNEDYRYVEAAGQKFDSGAKSRMIAAINGEKDSFDYGGKSYGLAKEGDRFYRISIMEEVAAGKGIKNKFKLAPVEGASLPADFTDAFNKAMNSGEKAFTTADGAEYAIETTKITASVFVQRNLALASQVIFTGEKKDDFDFRLAAERAMQGKADTTFTVNGESYAVAFDDDAATFTNAKGEPFGTASHFVKKAYQVGTVFPEGFDMAIQQAIADNSTSFILPNAEGVEQEYHIERKNKQYNVRTEVPTYQISIYRAPSWEHWLGTDANGMDVLTRLMYGGRISLMIGFIVVLLETALGVILGGVAGYFGKWLDNLIMRVVDIFNCIPSYPIFIIMGAIMDAEKVESSQRIFYLMIAMGVLGWPGIARIVRGQILSLREQEFMTAAEATGISVNRRIFRHLVPNVIPQLIVIDTMTLGGIILTEATLSFLGLGVKYPLASWGSIINAVSNIYVMTNYWFVWIPAGMLILLTVLGFNFIGDGLRDAFDPKMKR